MSSHDGMSPVGVPDPKVIRLCEARDEGFTELACDLPEDHKGEHTAQVWWGNDGEE